MVHHAMFEVLLKLGVIDSQGGEVKLLLLLLVLILLKLNAHLMLELGL